MLDVIKKTLLTGVGLAVMTKEKVEELAGDLVKAGRLSEQEGQQFVDELMQRANQSQKDLESRVEEMVHAVVAKLNLATKEDVAALEARIENLKGPNPSG